MTERMGLAELHLGDCLTVLRSLPADSVHCCCTSPPYYSLRDYGVAGQLGLEATPEEYVARMVEVFREVRRVLRPDGTLWLNLGDSYNASPPGNKKPMSKSGLNGAQTSASYRARLEETQQRQQEGRRLTPGLKPKDLLGTPWRVALALQADGWHLRADIIWAKPNPMPESVRDRPTKAHEYIFLLSKKAKYFYDGEAVREEMAEKSANRYRYDFGGKKAKELKRQDADGPGGNRTVPIGSRVAGNGRNLRSVWRISTRSYKGAHFATFPPALPERCIRAGTSARGCCPACGAPWVRVVERERKPTRPGADSKVYVPDPAKKQDALGDPRLAGFNQRWRDAQEVGNRDPQRHCTVSTSVGWKKGCKCPEAPPVPCTVLDPFLGSGTTLAVAALLGRRGVGVELSPQYLELARRRLRDALGMFALPGAE